MASKKRASFNIIIVLTVMIVAAGYIGPQFLIDYFKYDRYNKLDFIDSSTYQAVLLTNDQLYFGHLKDISSEYLILNDVHYIKSNNEGVGQLIKLGSIESYGPQDRMTINKDQVLFWENLRSDSTVIKMIQSK